MRRGFWYNHETGEFRDAIFTSHLRVVMDDPPIFGVTRELIDAEFAKTREKAGIEGVARRNILMAVLAHSPWVRWREMQPPLYSHSWSVEAWSEKRWNPSTEDLLKVVEEFTGQERQASDRFELKYLGDNLG